MPFLTLGPLQYPLVEKRKSENIRVEHQRWTTVWTSSPAAPWTEEVSNYFCCNHGDWAYDHHPIYTNCLPVRNLYRVKQCFSR